YRHSTSSWSAFKLRPAKIQPAKPITKETTRQTKTNHQNQPPALPPRGLGRCPISKIVPLPYAVSRPIDLRRDAILWRPERPQWSMQMAAPGALESAGVGLAGELRSLIRVENPRTPLKLNGRRDVQGRNHPATPAQHFFLPSMVRRKRNDSFPVSIMCARSVIRSNSALHNRGFGNTVVHSEKGRFVVTMIAARSARSEIT